MSDKIDNLKKSFDNHHENLKELFDKVDMMEIEYENYKEKLEEQTKQYNRLKKVTEKLIMSFVKKQEDKASYRKSAGYKL